MTTSPPTQDDDGRTFRRAVVLIFGVIAVLVALIIVVASLDQPTKAQRQEAHNQALGQPQSIASPDYGQAPKHSGDPGGWEQLALLGVLVVAIAGGGAYVVHASRSARRGRERSVSA